MGKNVNAPPKQIAIKSLTLCQLEIAMVSHVVSWIKKCSYSILYWFVAICTLLEKLAPDRLCKPFVIHSWQTVIMRHRRIEISERGARRFERTLPGKCAQCSNNSETRRFGTFRLPPTSRGASAVPYIVGLLNGFPGGSAGDSGCLEWPCGKVGLFHQR